MTTATRRTHRKSRAGCTPCKARRMKCDEATPACLNCTIRGVPCEYSSAARLAPRSLPLDIVSPISNDNASSSHAISPVTIHSPQPQHSDAVRPHRQLLELELMNHWTASTYLTVCNRAGQHNEDEEKVFWREVMPREALSHSYLLEAMFAITSLHLISLDPSLNWERYAAVAVRYHSSSLKSFRDILSQPTEDAYQAIYACSLAHFLLGIALSQFVPTLVKHHSIKADIFSLLGLWSGSRKISAMFFRQLLTKPIRILLTDKDLSGYPERDHNVSRAMDRLRTLNAEQHDRDPYHKHAVYTHAVNQLESHYIRLLNGTPAAFITWLIFLDDHVVDSLRKGETLASLMLMHWATILNQSNNNLWWSISSGMSLIDDITNDLSSLTETEQAACDWCHAGPQYRRSHIES